MIVMDRTARFYSNPTYGGGFPVFAGTRRRRRGGSFFGSLANAAMPILKSLASKGASQALSFAKDVAGDVMSGKNVKSALMSQGLRHAKRLGSEVLGSAFGNASKRRRTDVPSRKRASTSSAKQRTVLRRKRRANF